MFFPSLLIPVCAWSAASLKMPMFFISLNYGFVMHVCFTFVLKSYLVVCFKLFEVGVSDLVCHFIVDLRPLDSCNGVLTVGGEHSNSHDHVVDHANSHVHFGLEHFHSNSHSLQDLSVGLSVLAGIVLFLLVEKTVRFVEDNSGGANEWGHSHHHHHKNSKKLKHDSDDNDKIEQQSDNKKSGSISKMSSEEKVLDKGSDDCLIGEKQSQSEPLLQKRKTGNAAREDKPISESPNGSANIHKPVNREEPPSSLVFGYLNLFSDGVHNFTDGMALGSAFLLYGSVGGWSRTLFLLAHELPQEIGDFGILVRSGFSVSKALFFNFLSALVALSGTALALMLGQDPGQSSLIEGFTAGGFMYIAVAGVLAEMNNGSSSIKKHGNPINLPDIGNVCCPLYIALGMNSLPTCV
ncbi:ZIP metal ion transporter family [Actinidia rufa]|uniref:ZIP metal ion transporter family n=1 Tax=Actinidia rufa TaxID=165716 RepID=A0A7J0GZ03_9ERIC|nr:ZIP metal ion transporter family [Actinidia rufa]